MILPRAPTGVFIDANDAALAKGTFDLRPAPGSVLIDAGRIAPGVGNDFQGSAPDAGAYEAGGERWIAGVDWRDDPLDIRMVVRLEPPRSHDSVPLPARLLQSGIRSHGLQRLQELYDDLWAKGGRVLARKRAIALRERYPETSPEYDKHHAVVAELHREVALELRERAAEVLDAQDLERLERTFGGK